MSSDQCKPSPEFVPDTVKTAVYGERHATPRGEVLTLTVPLNSTAKVLEIENAPPVVRVVSARPKTPDAIAKELHRLLQDNENLRNRIDELQQQLIDVQARSKADTDLANWWADKHNQLAQKVAERNQCHWVQIPDNVKDPVPSNPVPIAPRPRMQCLPVGMTFVDGQTYKVPPVRSDMEHLHESMLVFLARIYNPNTEDTLTEYGRSQYRQKCLDKAWSMTREYLKFLADDEIRTGAEPG